MITPQQQNTIVEAIRAGNPPVWAYTVWGNLVPIRSMQDLRSTVRIDHHGDSNKMIHGSIPIISKIVVDNNDICN